MKKRNYIPIIKMVVLLIILSFTITFIGCKNGNPSVDTPTHSTEKVVPIFQGLEIKGSTKNQRLANTYINETELKDLIDQDFGVLTSDEISYFSTKEERKYITLNFYNPSQFEILSFVLNGIKYQSFQFSEDSTSSKINFAVTMPSKSGITEYIVDEIKYIDGTEIKDVIMDGNKSIKVGILYDSLPSVVTNLDITHTSVGINATIVDPANIVNDTKGEYRCYILSETGIVKKEKLTQGENSFRYDDLKVNKEYILITCASLDLYDGKGKRTYIIKEETFTTLDYINVTNEITSEKNIGININKNFPTVKIEKVELLLNNEVVNTINTDIVKFDNLLSNTTYNVKITYSFNNMTYETIKTYQTKALQEPVVDISTTPLKRNIEYEVLSTDPSNILNIEKIELIKNNIVLEDRTSKSGSFDDVLSNNTYIVKVTYSYDLNDGNSPIEKTVEKEVTTSRLQVPTTGLNTDVSTDKVVGNLVVSDIDNTVTLKQIEFIEEVSNILINTTKETTFEFSAKANTSYIIKVIYTYDNNEGSVETKEYTQTVLTKKEVPTIEVKTLVVTDTSCLIDIKKTDNNLVGEVKQINLYKNNVLIRQISLVDYSITNLESNTNYKVEVIYSYDLNDGTGSYEVVKEIEFTTNKETPVVNIKETTTKTSIKVEPVVTDKDNAIVETRVELFLRNTLVNTLSENYVFNDLYSNTKYTVVLHYIYDINNGNVEETVTKEITTTSFVVPVVDITVKSTNTTVNYEVTYTDVENTLEITKVEIRRGTTIVKTLEELSGNFINLLSNNNYEVVVYYNYDLNDGNERITSTVSKTITTESLVEPVVNINLTSTKTTINYEVLSTDPSNILNIEKIELIKNNVVLEDRNSKSGSFDDVLSNNTYVVKVTYSYDLNDGMSTIISSVSNEVTTKMLQKPSIGINIINISSSLIEGNVVKTDIENIIVINSVSLYNETNLQDTVYTSKFSFHVASNVSYKIVVDYSYDLKDGNGQTNEIYEYVVTSNKEAPTILLTPYNISQNLIEYNLLISDINSTGRVNIIALYKEGIYERRLSEVTTSIENLIPNTSYKIIINYVYDFNDGTGNKEINFEYSFKTLKRVPTYNLEVESTTDNSFNIHHVINDLDMALTFEKVELYLNEKLIETKLSINDLQFEKLLANNNYRIVSTISYDLNNGRETTTRTMYVKTKELSKPIINFDINPAKSSFTYNYRVTDNDLVVVKESVELYLNHTLQEKSQLENTYENLFSNNTYRLVVKLECNYRDGRENKVEIYETNVNTLPLSDIEFNSNLEANYHQVNYGYQMKDLDNISYIKEIRIYLNDQLVKTNQESDEKLFNDLLANNTYKVVYVVEKDFRDNNGIITTNYEKTITTKAYIEPNITMNFTSSQEVINIKLQTFDKDNLIQLNGLDVYSGDNIINTVDIINSLSVEGLQSNTIYTFKLRYAYDLKDGKGLIEKEVVQQYSTVAYNVVVEAFEVLNEFTPKTNEDVNFKLYLNNKSNVKLLYLIVNGKRVEPTGGNKLSDVIFVIRSANQSGKMQVNVEQMAYILNGIEVLQNVEQSVNIEVDVLSRLDILSVQTVDGSMFISNHTRPVIKIDNPEGFKIKSIVYNGSIITNLLQINENLIYVDEYNLSLSSINISSIEYEDSLGNISVRKYNTTFELNTIKIREDEYDAVKVNKIATPEDLLAMKSNKIYELANDIDMKGYTWKGESLSNVYFDGKGYSIKNLTILVENEYDKTNLTLFSGSNTTFKNVFFDNVYINIQSKSADITFFNNCNLDKVVFNGSLTGNDSDGNAFTITLSKGYTNTCNYYIVDEFINASDSNLQFITREQINSKQFREEALGWKEIKENYLEDENIRYLVIDNSYAIVKKYIGTNEYVEVPTSFNGFKVIGIADLAFKDASNIRHLRISADSMFTGGSILNGCSNLKILETSNFKSLNGYFGKVSYDNSYKINTVMPDQLSILPNEYYYIPNSLSKLVILNTESNQVTSIGNYTFNGYSSLTSIEILEGVTSIGKFAFYGCSNLTSIVIPNSVASTEITNSVASIGEFAFSGCSNLENITIPNSVTSIGVGTFQGCSSLTSIEIPNSVASIRDGAFYYCSSLTSIIVDKDNKVYDSRENCNAIIATSSNTLIVGCQNTEIPNSVTSIGNYAFGGCDNLQSIVIPNRVTGIGKSAFDGCSNLTSITIPNSVTSIGKYVFNGCSNLTIYCEAPEGTYGDSSNWNSNGCTIVWNYKEE